MALRLWGHRSIEPSAVDDQSNDRMTEAISPGLSRKVAENETDAALRCKLVISLIATRLHPH